MSRSRVNMIVLIALEINCLIVLLLGEYGHVKKEVTNAFLVLIFMLYAFVYLSISIWLRKKRKKQEGANLEETANDVVEELVQDVGVELEYEEEYTERPKRNGLLLIPIILLAISNVMVYNLETEDLDKFKYIIFMDKKHEFNGIYVIPERPSTTLSTDKVTIESYNKTVNEMKVSPADLNKKTQNNLSPYIRKY